MITETINTLLSVVNFLKCVVTEVLFSIVAFKTLTFHKVVQYCDIIITYFLLILTVKKKLEICQYSMKL